MSMNVDEIEQAMLALDKRELAKLIHRGIQALDESETVTPQPEVDAAWNAEFRRRIDEVESGEVELLPDDDVDARVDGLLSKFRG
ncbi:addiction module protein [Glutamicibacter sp. NPDC087344]|uniref:addiction module protein n=1 Tax=Glutamicibacter sp. NPDC087344 TaxID=3363994 RepID=UPI003820009C